jgi:hypothetical protein
MKPLVATSICTNSTWLPRASSNATHTAAAFMTSSADIWADATYGIVPINMIIR